MRRHVEHEARTLQWSWKTRTDRNALNKSRRIEIYICKVFHDNIRGTQHASCRVVRGCDDNCNSMRSWPIMHNKGSTDARLWLKANVLLRPHRSTPEYEMFVISSGLEFREWLVCAVDADCVNCTGNMSTNTRLQLSIAVQANNDCTNVPVDAHCSVIFKWVPLLTKFSGYTCPL